MKTTESVIASMKAAADKFVAVNRRQMIATLPKLERLELRRDQLRAAARVKPVVKVQRPAFTAPTRTQQAKAETEAVLAGLSYSRLFGMSDLRVIARVYNHLFKLVRDNNVLKIVSKYNGRTFATVTLELRPNGSRVLSAQLISNTAKLKPYVHTYGRVVAFRSYEAYTDEVSIPGKVRYLRSAIQDDVRELVDDVLIELHRRHRRVL